MSVGIMKEVWKDVIGYEGKYKVSNLGNIKSLIKNIPRKPFVKANGYLSLNMLGKKMYVHRAVALAFIPNPQNKPEVNHIDSDKQNNIVENLEWNTSSENHKHAASQKGYPKGENYPNSKLTNVQAAEIRERYIKQQYDTYDKLAEEYGVSRTTIIHILQGKKYKEKVPINLITYKGGKNYD